MKPLLSIFGSGIRINSWEILYNSLTKSSVPFELIIVGDKVPTFSLPDNFHYIYSKVKPAQCAEIAARYTTGELIMNVADDLVFSDSALNEMCNLYEKNYSQNLIVSNRLKRGNVIYGDEMHKFLDIVDGSPLIPMSTLMSKKLWNTLGGIDRRFTALFWDLDIAMRTLEIGGEILFANNSFTEEVFDRHSIISRIKNRIIKTQAQPGLYQEYGISIDRPLLDSFWVSNNKEDKKDIYAVNDENISVLKRRKEQFLPFKDNHLLTISQKPSGRW
jgi:hypothetical protein